MSSIDHDDDSDANARQQAELEKQIVQFEEATRQQKRFERRGCLGCAVMAALPVAFYTWQIGSIILGMREAADFEQRLAAVGCRVRFSGGDDMGRGLGVKGVSSIVIRTDDFSDKDMAKLAPFLIEAESFGYLSFSRTRITDEGLQHIPAGVKLAAIDFRETHVTQTGVDKLLLRLPHLQKTTIFFDGGAIKNNIVSLPDDSS